jgi:hypothetical protein
MRMDIGATVSWRGLRAPRGQTVTELRGGLIVHDDAIRLAIDLENRGHVCAVRDGVLTVTNGTKLKTVDVEQIKRLKFHLLAIAAYVPPEPN